MPNPNSAALDFLLTRRSRPAKTLVAPVPDKYALKPILTAALRTPDHGKLEPWRLIVLEKAALTRLAGMIAPLGHSLGIDPEKVEKARHQYADADLAVAVVFSPKDSEKVPHIEQLYSAGAVCLSLLNAALAVGWGPIGCLVGPRMIGLLWKTVLAFCRRKASQALSISAQNPPPRLIAPAPSWIRL